MHHLAGQTRHTMMLFKCRNSTVTAVPREPLLSCLDALLPLYCTLLFAINNCGETGCWLKLPLSWFFKGIKWEYFFHRHHLPIVSLFLLYWDLLPTFLWYLVGTQLCGIWFLIFWQPCCEHEEAKKMSEAPPQCPNKAGPWLNQLQAHQFPDFLYERIISIWSLEF